MNGTPCSMSGPARVAVAEPRGMTLLEVMLALSLTTVVLVAISMAIDIHLRMLDARRGELDRIQLARGVLQIIGNDLRSVIQQNTTDFSVLASMATEAIAGGEIPSDLADLAGDGGAGGSGSTGDGDADDAGAALSGGSGSAVDAMTGDSTTSTSSEDIAATSIPPPVPGLYGNQYELLIDVSRLPRVDEMQRMVASNSVNPLQDIPSDVKTVAYYYYDPNSSTSSGDFRDRAGNPQAGLVRRVLDRAVTLFATENSNLSSLQQQGEIIAPEVGGIEFQYFDGTEWLYEWDSEQQQGLPVAVRITLVMGDPRTAQTSSTSARAELSAANQQVLPDQIYSLVVRLPTALPTSQSDTTDSGMEAVGL